ncbi:hypothetical protein MATL_G00181890 [Megalops atlanticus]|uniref:Uncharacterized protein n=1 Tax=Megalops atlanticus TaxID=7932 RepID=A0A9D3PN86_MEGAT|nr:hypothetical protein MATL_G00181890 [Megalops atlanticus]
MITAAARFCRKCEKPFSQLFDQQQHIDPQKLVPANRVKDNDRDSNDLSQDYRQSKRESSAPEPLRA